MDTKDGLGLRLEEVRKVLAEHHGHAGQVTQSRNDASSFKLREKAGGQAGVLTEFHQAHGLFEPQTLDAFANMLVRNHGFCARRIDFGHSAYGHFRFVCHVSPRVFHRPLDVWSIS